MTQKALGRPSKWDPDWVHPSSSLSQCEHVVHVMKHGGHIAQVCVELGISKDTYYRWKAKYPAFKQACDLAATFSEAYYDEVMRKGAEGEYNNFNATAAIAIMNNKQGWTKKNEATSLNVTINNLSTLSQDQLDEQIQVSLKNIERLSLALPESEKEQDNIIEHVDD